MPSLLGSSHDAGPRASVAFALSADRGADSDRLAVMCKPATHPAGRPSHPVSGSRDTWFGLDERAKPLVRAGFVLGLGLGGFFDGIVFHQVLQFHHMLSDHSNPAVATNLDLNVFADGLFHVATYLLTVAGVVLLWRAWRDRTAPASGRSLLGSALVGWGLFNLLEGVVDHHILGIHHVWKDGPGGALAWDLAFLVWGAVMLVVGAALVRRDPAVAPDRRAT